MLKKLLIVFIFLCAPSIVSAHDSGFFIEKTVGDYFFDIGYSTEFVAGDFVRLDFLISKAETKELIPFTSAWVRIAEEGELIFAGPIAYGEFGKPGFSFVFPREGNYTFSIRFENGLKSIAEETFPIEVKPSPDSKDGISLTPFIFLILGLLAGFSGARLLKKHE